MGLGARGPAAQSLLGEGTVWGLAVACPLPPPPPEDSRTPPDLASRLRGTESLFLFLAPQHLAFHGISFQGGGKTCHYVRIWTTWCLPPFRPRGGGQGPSPAFEPNTQLGRGPGHWRECGRRRPAAGLRRPCGAAAPAGPGALSLSRRCLGSTSRALEGSARPGQRARPGTWGRNAGN